MGDGVRAGNGDLPLKNEGMESTYLKIIEVDGDILGSHDMGRRLTWW